MLSARYAAVYADLNYSGDACQTALLLIADECLTGKMQDKTMLLTGCYSGVGIEIARPLASTGCKLFLIMRNIPKGRLYSRTSWSRDELTFLR
jgi:hypothetical protein